MNISIVIPNYNGEKILQENLPKMLDAVGTYTKGKIEIIIADDASQDNSLAVLNSFKKENKRKHITIKIVENKNNQGFAGNVTSAVNVATGDVFVLLNTDVIPHKNFLAPLLKHFEDTKVFAVGCMDESIENEKTILRGRGVGKWTKGFLFHSAGSLNKDNNLWAAGGSSAFNKQIWDNIGGLNKLYNPFYWEDIDISYRAQKEGYNVLFEKESVVIHKHSTGAIQTNVQKNKIKKIAYRNQFFFVWLNITDSDLLFSHFLWLPYHLINAIFHADTDFLIGFFQAVRKLRQIIVSRNHITKLFVKTDREIFDEFV